MKQGWEIVHLSACRYLNNWQLQFKQPHQRRRTEAVPWWQRRSAHQTKALPGCWRSYRRIWLGGRSHCKKFVCQVWQVWDTAGSDRGAAVFVSRSSATSLKCGPNQTFPCHYKQIDCINLIFKLLCCLLRAWLLCCVFVLRGYLLIISHGSRCSAHTNTHTHTCTPHIPISTPDADDYPARTCTSNTHAEPDGQGSPRLSLQVYRIWQNETPALVELLRKHTVGCLDTVLMMHEHALKFI